MPPITDALRADLTWIAFVRLQDVIAVGPALFGTGMGLAALASVLALRRFLTI